MLEMMLKIPTTSNSPDPPRLMHLCYGGLGGHNAVVTSLASKHRFNGYKSDAILVANKHKILCDSSDWPGVDNLFPIRTERRGDLKSLWSVYSIVKERKPIVIFCHTHRQILGAWLGQLFSLQRPHLILIEHQAISLRSLFDNLWSLIGVIFCETTVLLTAEYAEKYPWRKVLIFLRRKQVVISNGIDLPDIGESMKRTQSRTITIGMAARLVASKDVSTILRSVALLKRRTTSYNYRFLVAGDGPQKVPLQCEADVLDLNQEVFFLGHLNKEEIDKFYRQLDVYVHSSEGETLCMAILEAASYGLPIVASDVEGIRNILNSDSIQLFKFQDSQDLTMKLSKYEDFNFARRTGQRARIDVELKYNADSAAQKYLRLIRES